MIQDNTPILVGVGQVTEKGAPLAEASSPLDLIEQAAYAAAEDAGLAKDALADLDTLVIVRGFREPTKNSPAVIQRRIGASKAQAFLTPHGGNTPQYLVNRYAEAITKGQNRFVLFAGSEAMDTGRRIIKEGGTPDWNEPDDEDATYLFPDVDMSNDYEKAHGVFPPASIYPMFENALRQHYGRAINDHQMELGKLFAGFTKVAATSPHAWYPIERSAEEIATATDKNRYVGWPYTKFMNAMNQINQSAAILMTSVGEARKMGIAEDNFVYLHGCADAAEIWNVQDRVNYHSSPAIREIGKQTFDMAGISVDDVDFIDIYSCFPVAVEIACDELGIAKDDPRGLTVTGGLPFHGGAGNNYVMNSIAAMVDKVREKPGSMGLVTANGGYLTKHAAGLYSTTPTEGEWQRVDPATYQAKIDAMPRPTVVEEANGHAVIETYTVLFGRSNEAEAAIVIGRLGDAVTDDAPRFLALVNADQALLTRMTQSDFMGAAGSVAHQDGRNIFTPAA